MPEAPTEEEVQTLHNMAMTLATTIRADIAKLQETQVVPVGVVAMACMDVLASCILLALESKDLESQLEEINNILRDAVGHATSKS